MGTMQFFDWVNRHARLVVVVVVVAALGLGVVAPIVADTNDPSFDPTGEVFDVYARAAPTRCSRTPRHSTRRVSSSSRPRGATC